MASKTKGYEAEDILVLEGLEPVRKRPGMYIGSTGIDGLHHMLTEIFDNGRDEAMGGFATEIEVALLPDGVVRVADNGRGIPVDIHPKTKVSSLETVMTTLHAGGKFEGKGYKISGGLHGVGASVVNALSEWLWVIVHRDGGAHYQEYVRGKKKEKVKKVSSSKYQGTVVAFKADREVFSETEYVWERIIAHMREQAYLTKGLLIRVIDARSLEKSIDAKKTLFLSELGLTLPSYSFYFEGGLISLVRHYNHGQKPIHKTIFHVEKEAEQVMVEIALQYVDDITARELCFANNTATPEGGMHLTGFRTALTRILNDYAKKNNGVKEADGNFSGDDVREGLVAVILVKLPNPQFEGQTKAKLGSVEARSAVESVFGDAFRDFMEEKPDDARMIIGKVALAMKARKAAKAAKDSVLRKGALEGMTLPGKLADCQTKSAEEAELFIVEGDSAGGSGKQGRDRRTQAVLPLKGKILNVERARLDKILAFQEIKHLIIALGAAIGDAFDLSKLRYHKIIIATDADVDGAHIRTLLLTLFFRHFVRIIEGGYLYIAQPPLYKIKYGKESYYAFSDDEKAKVLSRLGVDASAEPEPEQEEESEEELAEEVRSATADRTSGSKRTNKVSIQRYKGLGEMNPDELWETTMDPERRILKQVTVHDAEEADRTFDTLMGADVSSRRHFIQTHAKLANLDV